MKLRGKTLLVTGGAGFIGSHFVEEYAKTHTIIVYDNFASNVVTPSQLKTFGVSRVVKGDILDREKLTKAMKGVDVVFHFAVACVRLSLSDEAHVHEVNATGTLFALLAAKKAGVKQFVYISSSEVYGTTHGESIDESHGITPQTVYGMSKYVGELYAKHFNDIEGLPSCIIRPFNAYGPRAHFDGVYGEVIPRFTIQALSGTQLTVFGDGSQTRDFTYVKDTVTGIYAAAEEEKLRGDVINIAFGKEVSVRTIAQTICRHTNLPYQPDQLPPRPNDVDRLAANTKKAGKLLGFSPKTAIETGLELYVDWVKQSYRDTKKLLRQIPSRNW